MAANENHFLTSHADILKALLQSKHDGTAIAIRAKAFGEEAIVTCVEDVLIEGGQIIIVMKHYDTSGYILPYHKLNLIEIQGVYPFATQFSNPYLANIEKERTWYF
jgi:hypothetical protein